MPYRNDDEAKRAARARLEQRMSRRGASTGEHRRAEPSRPSMQAATGIPHPTRLVVIAIALAIVAAVAIAMAVSRCSATVEPAPGNAETTQTPPTAQEGQESQTSSGTEAPEDPVAREVGEAAREELVDLIGEEEASKLLATAATDADALWIASHASEYDIDGIEVQMKILKLAADEPAAIPYVRSFPAQYPLAEAVADASLAMEAGSPSADVPATGTPHFYQWDRRWGNTVYSSAAFGLTGCGPTSYAMAYQGVTGKTDIDPYEMGRIAEERGYMSEFNGTANAFFGDMAEELGMSYEELYPTAENLIDALSSGHVVIAHLGPGLFTTRGHFFVLAGVADNGEVILNDPYSYERSSRTWPAETIAEEATTYYSLSALDREDG